MSGSSVIETNGQQRPAALGEPVQVGDTINVSQDSKLRLRMNDGSVVTLAPGTRMTVAKYDVDGAGARRDAELSMSAGLLHAVVSAGSGVPNFEVKTATGVAAVRGTEWYVDSQGSDTQVYVVTGKVSLTDLAGHGPVTIPQMSESTVAVGKPPAPIRPVTQAELQTLAARTALQAGLCQCVRAGSDAMPSCRTTAAACEAICGAGHYTFVPTAPFSCGSSP
ncbi:MAG: FecR domain-containing protein [Alphaproteobacteria bacterium]|nr:FecR domain-containing protein [Alphaproteobacteria bacterium]